MSNANDIRGPRGALVRYLVVGVLLSMGLTASAQSKDPAAPFLGTWSGVFTTQDNEFWSAADLMCFGGCPLEMYKQLSALLNDPANDSRSVGELAGQSSAGAMQQIASILTPLGKQVQQENAPDNDPKLHCQPYGFVREVINPLPMRIRRDGEHLFIQYEEWSLLRTIYMDGRAHPEHRTPTLLGHSVGRIENGVLIVETARVMPGWISDLTHAGHSGELTAVERYTLHENPRRLELELTITDPLTFTKPYVLTKTWLFTPEVELLQDQCGEFPGKF